jgi:hypothetical protein
MMFNATLHLAKRTAKTLACAALALALVGCQSIAGTALYTQVRFVDASPDAPSVDFYENTTAVIYGTSFGSTSSYIPINPGNYSFGVDVTKTQQQLATVKATVVAGGEYTVIAGNVASSLQMTVLQDQATPAPGGQVSLRFIDQATRIGAVDIYLLPSGGNLTGASAAVSNISLGKAPTYINISNGTYSIVIFPAGTVPSGTTSSLYTGSQISYSGSAALSYVMFDQQVANVAGLQVIGLADYQAP